MEGFITRNSFDSGSDSDFTIEMIERNITKLYLPEGVDRIVVTGFVKEVFIMPGTIELEPYVSIPGTMFIPTNMFDEVKKKYNDFKGYEVIRLYEEETTDADS